MMVYYFFRLFATIISPELDHEADGRCDSKKTGNRTDRLAVKMASRLANPNTQTANAVSPATSLT